MNDRGGGDDDKSSNNNSKREERKRRLNNLIRTYEISNSGSGRYMGRPIIPEGFDYADPTLFQCAHNVFDLKGDDDVVISSIYLGPKLAASEEAYESLATANVGAIVNATNRVPCYHRQPQERTGSAEGQKEHQEQRQTIKYCQVPVNDVEFEDILSYLVGATAFIHACLTGDGIGSNLDDDVDEQSTSSLSSPTSVLVHCEVGMSRSSTIVIAYLMRYHGMTRDEAYVEVKKRRPLTNPNQGFWKQLSDFELWVQQQNRDKDPKSQPMQGRDCRGSSSSLTDVTAGAESGIEVMGTNATADPALPVFDKDWAFRSNTVYCTCIEVPQTILRQDCWQQLLQHEEQIVSNREMLSDILYVCLDFIWGRNVLEIDVQWMSFVLTRLELARRRLSKKEETADEYTVFELAHVMLLNTESQFQSSWAGEIYEWQVQRCQKEMNVAQERLTIAEVVREAAVQSVSVS